MALIGVEAGDQPWMAPAPPQGGPVNKYDVEINGVKTTLLLNDADAQARGLKEPAKPAAKEAKAPANKARTPANKSAPKADA